MSLADYAEIQAVKAKLAELERRIAELELARIRPVDAISRTVHLPKK